MCLYWYCKPTNNNEKLKTIKIISVFITGGLFQVVILPHTIAGKIFTKYARRLSIQELFENPTPIVIALTGWIILVAFSLVIFLYLGIWVTYFFNIDKTFTFESILHYSLFISIFLTNKIIKCLYFCAVKISDKTKKERITNQISLSWNYVFFLVSLVLYPLHFDDESTKELANAILYATAITSLMAEIKKPKEE
ncbi:MAG: hypothetical protein FWG65_08510 [Turicibacter sp.]|nr:hypothetical protein [Turicibacter sp.]